MVRLWDFFEKIKSRNRHVQLTSTRPTHVSSRDFVDGSHVVLRQWGRMVVYHVPELSFEWSNLGISPAESIVCGAFARVSKNLFFTTRK